LEKDYKDAAIGPTLSNKPASTPSRKKLGGKLWFGNQGASAERIRTPEKTGTMASDNPSRKGRQREKGVFLAEERRQIESERPQARRVKSEEAV